MASPKLDKSHKARTQPIVPAIVILAYEDKKILQKSGKRQPRPRRLTLLNFGAK